MSNISIQTTFNLDLCKEIIGEVEIIENDATHSVYASADSMLCATSG